MKRLLCFLGIHKYETFELPVKEMPYSRLVMNVDRCSCCFHIRAEHMRNYKMALNITR